MTLIRLHNEDLGFETNCFVCEPTNERGLRIPFRHDTDRDVVVADFRLDDAFSGAPTMAHGGVTLAILDEAMAWACIAIGRQWAVTTETTTRFERAVVIGDEHRVEAEIREQRDDAIRTSGRVVDADGRVCAEATATFTPLGEAQVRRAAGVTEPDDPTPTV